jgi:hypothetical protein
VSHCQRANFDCQWARSLYVDQVSVAEQGHRTVGTRLAGRLLDKGFRVIRSMFDCTLGFEGEGPDGAAISSIWDHLCSNLQGGKAFHVKTLSDIGWEVGEGNSSSEKNTELYECLQVIDCLSDSLAQALVAEISGNKLLRQILAWLKGIRFGTLTALRLSCVYATTVSEAEARLQPWASKLDNWHNEFH